MDIVTIIIVFLVGLAASFIGGLVGGGGGLLSIPVLNIFGLPANIAVATNRFGSLGMAISSIFKFAKAKKIIFKYVLLLTVLSIIGSIIGAKILIEIDEALLSKMIGVLILIMLPLVFVKGNFGIVRRVIPKYYKIFGFIGYFGIAIYDGFFGAGAGIIATYTLVFLFGLTYIEANATDKIPWFLNTIISASIFAYYGLIHYFYGIILLLGMLVGGYIGAHIAIKKGNNFIRMIFSIIVIISAGKLIFF